MRHLKLAIFILFVGLMPNCVWGVSVDSFFSNSKNIELIRSATFEIVTPKPVKDSLTYEKPLPLDLIPYAIRNDAYYSIGTAFAVGNNTIVSASHVMNMGARSQYNEVYLRDRSGKIYSIDVITKFSNDRDFVVFSLKDREGVKEFFEVNTQPQLNQRVYAVGNALGEGIVVRDGLLTSTTPEEEDGRWRWLRFSAAASPGNSGGPLLDQAGRVLGVVLRKSENENLNYALPISEVLNAREDVANLHFRGHYRLDNMDMTKKMEIDKEFKLPRSYSELNRAMIDHFEGFSSGLLAGLLSENREDIFPNGVQSLQLLNDVSAHIFPNIIAKDDDGSWKSFYPSKNQKAELGNNGYMNYGNMINSIFLHLRKPDNVSSEQIFTDSKLFMDLILKGIGFNREIGNEKIKVISLGRASEEYDFVDTWGRAWQVRTWLIEYSDVKVVTFTLPVPGGCICILRSGQTGHVDAGLIPDLKALVNFIHLSYYGSFEQWQEFLQLKDRLPKIFTKINLTFEYGNKFIYSSQRLHFSSTPEIMTITGKSDLHLVFGYFQDGENVVWDVAGIVVGEDVNTTTNFNIVRESRPPTELNDSYQSDWSKMLQQQFPYNRSSFVVDGATVIRMARPIAGAENEAPLFSYNISYKKSGSAPQEEMAATLDKISGRVKVLENGVKTGPREGAITIPRHGAGSGPDMARTQ